MISASSLPFRKPGTPHWQKTFEYTLTSDLRLEQWIVPMQTTIKLKTTENFGWICLPENCKDLRGFVIPCRIFKY